MENVENLLVIVKEFFKILIRWSPNGRCGLNSSKPLHTYCISIFALQIYIHSQFRIDFKHASICNPSIHHIHDYL